MVFMQCVIRLVLCFVSQLNYYFVVVVVVVRRDGVGVTSLCVFCVCLFGKWRNGDVCTS